MAHILSREGVELRPQQERWRGQSAGALPLVKEAGSQAVLALNSSSWSRAPVIMHERSDVSITISNPRFTAPAANDALAQCMTALMPCLCADSRILSQVERWTGSGLSPRGTSPNANDRSAGPI